MSMMVAELYDALKDAGASEEAAKKAATAIADYNSGFDSIDRGVGCVANGVGDAEVVGGWNRIWGFVVGDQIVPALMRLCS